MATLVGIRGGATDKELQWKTDEYNRFLKELRAKLGDKTTMQRLVEFEVGRIVEKASSLTGKATLATITKSVNSKKVIRGEGGRYYAIRNTASGKVIRDRMIAKRVARIGLAKKSWFWIADKLGQSITVPQFVQNASEAHSGWAVIGGPMNVKVTRMSSEDKSGVAIANNMPIITFPVPNGRQALFSAIAGRIGAYKNNLRTGVFNDVAAISKKYKGVMVTTK